jgi:surface polysaccharide O-acyltransferase-like enzyme
MKRNSAIDCIRVLAIFKVISVHVESIKTLHHEWPAFFMGHVNFAVAFFLVVSGYQWSKKIRAGKLIGEAYAKYSLGLLKLFVLWSLVYIFVADGAISEYTHYGVLSPLKICYWNSHHLLFGRGPLWKALLYIFLDGTKYHLWFLMGLVCVEGHGITPL